ncbi:MAG: ABC-2 family transporter protein [Chloroflexota bacterium]
MLRSLRLDLEYAKRGYRRWEVYPAATFAGVFVNTVFGFLRAYVLLALYAHREVVGGYDAAAAVTYTWLTQALIMTVFIWGWRELALRIRTGDIATDLVRPVHPLRAGLAFDLGRALYHLLFRGVPPFLVGAAVFPLILPASPLVWLAFLASVALAVTVSFAIRWLYNASAFWLMDDRGVMIIAGTAISLFSGFLIPVTFFPDWLAAIAYLTPFPSIVQIPVDIFVGRAAGPDLLLALATQVAWAAMLLLVARGVFTLGVRRLVVQGG